MTQFRRLNTAELDANQLIWEEVLVDRRLNNSEIVEAISSILGIDTHEITTFNFDEWPYKELPNSIRLICETTPYDHGEFPMRVSFYLRDTSINTNRRKAMGQFCESLCCRGLISDDSIDQYSWILVHGPNSCERVLVDDFGTDGIQIIGPYRDS
jgi:hypothetical protein